VPVRFVCFLPAHFVVAMWKHVVVAASFDHAWATTNPVTGQSVVELTPLPDIDGAAGFATTLLAGFATVSTATAVGVTAGVGTAVVTAKVGVTGTLNVTAPNPAAFYEARSSKKVALEEWLSNLVPGVPQANVVVTIPEEPTTTPHPVVAAPADSAESVNSTSGAVSVEGASSGPASVRASDDPVAGVIQTTFVVTLPPGKAEMSSRLQTTPPADLLAGFTAQFSGAGSTANVSAVSVTMAEPTATEAVGTFVLTVSDTSAQGIQSVASQNSIRTAISQLVGVYLGDVGTIAITTANLVPIDSQPQANDTVGASEATARRLTPGSVNAGFRILVPGHRAQGWQKDCSLQKISSGVLPAVEPTVNGQNPFTDVTTPGACGAAAVARGTGTVWSFDQSSTECTISDLAHLSEATFSADSITQFNDGSDGCGSCPSVITNPTAWPGANSSASHAAFDGGKQPTNLQCWPKNANFDLMPCGSQELEALGTRGWPGACNNLGDATDDATQAECQTSCQADPFCTIWMWATAAGGPVDAAGVDIPQCRRGTGNGCWTVAAEGGSADVIAAQRLQHGEVNIIKDELREHVIKNLQQQFAQNVGVGNVNLNTSDAQKTACRNICHSTVMCNYWQSFFDPSLTGMDRIDLGCWMENPGVDAAGRRADEVATVVPYPLTTDGIRIDDPETNLITGGQFIQHHCAIPTLPTRPPTTTTTTTTLVIQAVVYAPTPDVSGGFMNPWGYLLIAAGVIAAIAGVVLLMNMNKPTKTRAAKTRAVKPIKAKEQPPPPPQPVVPLMAQQIMVQPTIQQPLAMTTMMAGQQPYAQAMAQPYGGQQFMQRPY